ncbi:MAG: hypothetical protein LBS77_03090 [Desulfovibrio sp.]|jgi:hypothetical protein|nr:hypothetical protein [Desulfovibrio sp.]
MKMISRIVLVCMFLGAAALSPNAAQSAVQQATQTAKPIQDKPEKGVDRVTQVSVQLEGTDSIGARLGTQLNDRFNRSSLFSLTTEGKDAPKLQLLLTTSPEFSGRPAVGSIYSVCWVFSQGSGYLAYLLARDMGTVSYEDIEALADKLVERTDGIAAKYGNLWK